MPLLETFVSVIAPHSCLICSREGRVLCDVCLELEILSVPSRCYKCQKATKEFSTCVNCFRKSKLGHVWVRTVYDDVTSKVVLKFKLERARAAYLPIGKAMAQLLPLLPEDVVLVGVPTATSRIRQRGYDHVKLLVREISARTGLTWARPVVRFGQMHQFGSTRAVRLEQLENAYKVVSPTDISGKRILLVDDVLTTGATLEMLANALKNAGAKQVDAVVFAQKM